MEFAILTSVHWGTNDLSGCQAYACKWRAKILSFNFVSLVSYYRLSFRLTGSLRLSNIFLHLWSIEHTQRSLGFCHLHTFYKLTNLGGSLCQIDNTIIAHITKAKPLSHLYMLWSISNTRRMSRCIISELRPIFAQVQLANTCDEISVCVERSAICIALNILFLLVW